MDLGHAVQETSESMSGSGSDSHAFSIEGESVNSDSGNDISEQLNLYRVNPVSPE